MYYELYIDVFFLVNFMMDAILLEILRKILGCPVSHGRVLLGAGAGAFGTLRCPVPAGPVWVRQDRRKPWAYQSYYAENRIWDPVGPGDGQSVSAVVYQRIPDGRDLKRISSLS